MDIKELWVEMSNEGISYDTFSEVADIVVRIINKKTMELASDVEKYKTKYSNLVDTTIQNSDKVQDTLIVARDELIKMNKRLKELPKEIFDKVKQEVCGYHTDGSGQRTISVNRLNKIFKNIIKEYEND